MIRASLGSLLLAGALLVGCTGPQPEPSPTPEPGVSSPATAPVQPTEPAPSPDPSTAGGLSAQALPQEFLGFVPDVREPEEGEFVPNGTWVYGQDAAESAEHAWPRCGGEAPTEPPAHALMGMYAHPDGALGVGQAFEFADAARAQAWFGAYAAEVARCAGVSDAYTAVTEQERAGDVLVDRRLLAGAVWGERAWVSDARVFLIAVQRDASLAELAAAVG